ncbi:hypothetical protein B0H14DRAFT_3651608 [Mycena olivaceomarginata]|nr:hypothetical protein B0H14DRAFT_3651608 [Mycena olivaceomarginata]
MPSKCHFTGYKRVRQWFSRMLPAAKSEPSLCLPSIHDQTASISCQPHIPNPVPVPQVISAPHGLPGGANDIESSIAALLKVAPWEGWEVKDDLLEKLKEWNEDETQDTAVNIMKKVQRKLDSAAKFAQSEFITNALELIPNDPFPIKTVVTGLVNLMIIGIAVPKVKQEAFTFAMEVVGDMSKLAEAFGKSSASEQSLVFCWKNLQSMRNVVNDICEWAFDTVVLTFTYCFLSCTHFSKTKGIPIESNSEKAIHEFKGRINRALVNFSVCLKGSRFGVGHSGNLKFPVQIIGFGNIKDRMDFIQRTLKDCVASIATYNQQQDYKHECHEKTREQVLEKIVEWLAAPAPDDSVDRCQWITGQPGVGKSSIAVTIAQRLQDEKLQSARLYGQFFINWSLQGSHTDNPHYIFPTIALQLATASPEAAIVIHAELKQAGTIVHQLSDAQAEALFVRPLSAIAHQDPSRVIVTLFDGVDELWDGDSDMLSKFTSILTQAATVLPCNVKILVFSRPEGDITTRLATASSVLRLDLLTDESRQDVREFFQAELPEIANWPQLDNHIDLLCDCAAGHLGWATLALHWIKREVKRRGNTPYIWEGKLFYDVNQVRKVNGMREANIYDLYAFILRRIVSEQETIDMDEGRETDHLNGCRAVLGCLVVFRKPETIRTITSLLGLQDTFDVLNFFLQISSIVVKGLDPIDNDTIPSPHKSFIDYLTSRHCDPRFQVQRKEQHLVLGAVCLRVLNSSLAFNMWDLKTSEPKDLQNKLPEQPLLHILYACGELCHHLQHTESLTPLVCKELTHFLKNVFLYWAEIIFIERRDYDPQVLIELSSVGDTIQSCNTELKSLLRDAHIFVSRFCWAIAENPAHTYISALPFTASSSLISKHYQHHYTRTIHTKCSTSQPILPVIRAAVTNNCLAALMGDGSLSIFDLDTGVTKISSEKLSQVPMNVGVNTESIKSWDCRIALSSDTKFVAVGFKGWMVWRVDDETMLSSSPKVPNLADDDNENIIWSMAFSPDSERLVVGYKNGNLQEWNVISGVECRQFQLIPHRTKEISIVSVAYLQCDGDSEADSIVSISSEPSNSHQELGKTAMHVWDRAGHGHLTLSESYGHPSVSFLTFDSTLCICFYVVDLSRPHGKVSGEWRIHNILTGSRMGKSPWPIHTPSAMRDDCSGWSYTIRSDQMTISEDGRFAIIYGAMCISVWDYQAAGASEFLVKLVGHSWHITTAAFLGGPRKYQFVTTSEDGTIRIWDLDRLLKGTLSEEEKRIVLWSNAPITVLGEYERGSWIKNADGEILFYLPQDCPFRNPLNIHVLGECVELDMTNFVYGTEWTKCRELSPAIESVMQRNDHDGGN